MDFSRGSRYNPIRIPGRRVSDRFPGSRYALGRAGRVPLDRLNAVARGKFERNLNKFGFSKYTKFAGKAAKFLGADNPEQLAWDVARRFTGLRNPGSYVFTRDGRREFRNALRHPGSVPRNAARVMKRNAKKIGKTVFRFFRGQPKPQVQKANVPLYRSTVKM